MQSCLFEGRVRHRRRVPIEHHFDFKLFLLYLDLDELPEIESRGWLWSAERPALLRFRRGDHLGDPKAPLADCVRDLVEARTNRRPEGPIRLLTNPRHAAFSMNPVSFYYCFDARGERLDSVVAEVTNTPWGERHCYVVSPGTRSGDSMIRSRCDKEFHVSPFMEMALSYDWQIRSPGDSLGLRIANRDRDGRLVFEAAIGMKRCELDARGVARMLWRYPLQTQRIAAAIYWQALRLYVRGAPFHPHPESTARPVEMTP